MTVRPTTERMTYAVQSRTRKTVEYRVDLLANNGAGFCACTDWATRRSPAITRGEPMGTRLTMCIHVNAARREFLNALLQDLAKSEQE